MQERPIAEIKVSRAAPASASQLEASIATVRMAGEVPVKVQAGISGQQGQKETAECLHAVQLLPHLAAHYLRVGANTLSNQAMADPSARTPGDEDLEEVMAWLCTCLQGGLLVL